MSVATSLLVLALGLPLAAAQDTGVLRITVVLTDADGTATPIPRVVLLVSDNPATGEPRRVRTGADGAVEIKLPPGNYTVESDAPVALGTQSYLWTQTIDVARGSNALSLTPANAEINTDAGGAAGVGAMRADSAVIFNKWRDSLVQLWTPTAHASGFLIDARGLIATHEPAVRDATAVEVELNGVKIAGRAIASDRQQGVAIIWIDPAAAASIPVIPPDCNAPAGPMVQYEQQVVALAAPMLEPKSAILGTVGRVETAAFEVDWRLAGGSAGGPVFDAGGRAIGITVAGDEREDSRRRESQVVPLSHACSVLAVAEKTIAGAAPPPPIRLRVEDSRAAAFTRKPPEPKATRKDIPIVSSSNFDISLMTPAMAESDGARANPRTDFGHWTEYVTNAPPVLLVRATPKFEESLWKTILRGAAATQGAVLPPLRSFGANFLRLRAFCGAVEVAPIHPFIILRELQDRRSIREGLYVFAAGDFGPHCATVRVELFSEKAPDKADSVTIDPQLFPKLTGYP